MRKLLLWMTVFVILFSVKVQATNLVSTTSHPPLVLILVTHLPTLDNARLRFISNFMIALQIRYLYFVKTYIMKGNLEDVFYAVIKIVLSI